MPNTRRRVIDSYPFADEATLVTALADKATPTLAQSSQIAARARGLVEAIRAGRKQAGGIEEFMQEYQLSSEEGVVLMCLAEALLRIPDKATADKLIADKIGGAGWAKHLGKSDSLFVNASTWGLMLTGNIIDAAKTSQTEPVDFLSKMIARAGEPVIRQALRHAMKIMAAQFVLGRSIDEALSVAEPMQKQGFRFSYDMLGEAAHTMKDAERYYDAYYQALETLGKKTPKNTSEDVFSQPSISIKLSAIHPRYEESQLDRVRVQMLPKLIDLAQMAAKNNLGLTIDAEEMDRLDLSLEVFAALANQVALKGWNGLGLAVQAYSKRALPTLHWLAALAEKTGRKIPIRLVKGAYWDTEIKRAQEQGLASYPVFTRKVSTDASYLACAKYMLENRNLFYPQFASHNAHTISAVSVMAGDQQGYECQRLHGMGQALFSQIIVDDGLGLPARIYAPVGSHEDLLAYLVRRLLENGANSSFVNRLSDDKLPISEIIEDPVNKIRNLKSLPHPDIAAPRAIFAPRTSAAGLALWHQPTRDKLTHEITTSIKDMVTAAPIIDGNTQAQSNPEHINSPQDNRFTVGRVHNTANEQVANAIKSAHRAQKQWCERGGTERAKVLRKAADLYETNAPRLLSLLIYEAGKTMENAIADLREAVDFLRYYADQAEEKFSHAQQLPGPTGEQNQLSLAGRGIFTCISPWNFPLAIFTGQVSAGLAAGNAVLAKPAEQTPLVAFEAVKLLHKAGVVPSVLQYLPGSGAIIGAKLVSDPATSGIAFTGSTQTAKIINQTIANRAGPIIPFIAETGGMNAMLVDSTALPEQVVTDVIKSAFDSAGQRCSAARILFLQKDIAKKTLKMLTGAMEELVIGNPLKYATDIGPVIDTQAQSVLNAHKTKMATNHKTIIDLPLPAETKSGTFVSPAAYLLDDISDLKKEVFGPILHVVEYESNHLDKVCKAINNTGYGLTFGVHTRVETTANYLANKIAAGNIYINRNQIGAVVGSQPFGGQGLSGTGPKAGGPNYLSRFAHEKVVTTDITASGGNAALLSLSSI